VFTIIILVSCLLFHIVKINQDNSWKSDLSKMHIKFGTSWLFITLMEVTLGLNEGVWHVKRDLGEVTKKRKKEDTCVYGYCLDPSYNTLDLPSKTVATQIRMNLEVYCFSKLQLNVSQDDWKFLFLQIKGAGILGVITRQRILFGHSLLYFMFTKPISI